MLKYRKYISNLYKHIIYKIFFLIYGKINSIYQIKNSEGINYEKVNISDNEHKIYFCNKTRLYTDRVHDLAIIKNNSIINGPSFQYRDNKNANCDLNSVFSKGTPRIKKKIKGKIFSLLTGGGGNRNYWHWLFDVLPRMEILEKFHENINIDFYLFPNLDEKFQIESLDVLNIPSNKRLSSKIYRHVSADQIITTSHPYNILNEPLLDSLNIPHWITNFLRKKFLIRNANSNKKLKKIFINRKDGKTYRFISNEKAVEDLLKKKGFKSITMSDYNFLDQIRIFNSAEYIVGLHGAGFANTVFCEPKTKILELKANTAGDAIKNLAEKNQLTYNHLSFKNKTFDYDDQNGDIEVDINLLNKTL